MGIPFLTISSLLLFLLLGLTVVDADLAMQKKQEVKSLLELANHDATFAIDEALKTEGLIELNEPEAINRFNIRMHENGGYVRQSDSFVPTNASVTTDPLAFLSFYINFTNWQQTHRFTLHYDGITLRLQNLIRENTIQPSGGYLSITVIDEQGRHLSITPKKMVGPSLVAVAYVHDQPFTSLLPAHAFPVVSVEELKW